MWLSSRNYRAVRTKRCKKVKKNKILYLATGSQGEPMGAMNRIINGVHPDVKLESGDSVIFSSKIIPGKREKIIPFTKLDSKKQNGND